MNYLKAKHGDMGQCLRSAAVHSIVRRPLPAHHPNNIFLAFHKTGEYFGATSP
jgi:hypothetical protein